MKNFIYCTMAACLMLLCGCEKNSTGGGLEGEWQVTNAKTYYTDGSLYEETLWEDYFSLTHTVFGFADGGRGYHLHDEEPGEYEYEYDGNSKTLMIYPIHYISSPWIPVYGSMQISSVKINGDKMSWHITGNIVDGETYKVDMRYELKRISKKTDFSKIIPEEER